MIAKLSLGLAGTCCAAKPRQPRFHQTADRLGDHMFLLRFGIETLDPVQTALNSACRRAGWCSDCENRPSPAPPRRESDPGWIAFLGGSPSISHRLPQPRRDKTNASSTLCPRTRAAMPPLIFTQVSWRPIWNATPPSLNSAVHEHGIHAEAVPDDPKSRKMHRLCLFRRTDWFCAPFFLETLTAKHTSGTVEKRPEWTLTAVASIEVERLTKTKRNRAGGRQPQLRTDQK